MSEFTHEEPAPIETPQNDETLGGNFLSIGHIKDPRHRQYLRTLDTIFDMQREKFPTILEFVEFDPKTGSRIVTYDPFKPENQGVELIDAKSFLYSLAAPSMIVSYDTKFNENINLLVDEKNKIPWSVETANGPIKIAMRLQNTETISGIGITFNNFRPYKITASFFNEEGHMISQILEAAPAMSTNLKQFFLLNNPVENITKVSIELEEQTTDAMSVYSLKNISIFNYTNNPLLRSMYENNIIELQEIENPVFLKEMPKDDILGDNNPAPS